MIESILYKTAIDCRLSLDDGSLGGLDSIQTQKMMLEKYCRDNNLTIKEVYIDDGYSGLNFDRPAFKRLIADIESGKINLVITKDLSRLGRYYLQTGYYTEQYFPLHNVRYIAVNDGVDTLIDNNEVTEGYTYTYEMGLLRTVNKVGTDSNTYNYLYDSSGRRVQKIVGAGNTNAIKRYKYTYIGDMLINETLSNDGVGVIKEVEYLYDNNGLLYLNGELVDEYYLDRRYSDTFTLEKFVGKGVTYDEGSNKFIIEDGYYFVMGDNRNISLDSRLLGLFEEDQLVGKVEYRLNSLFDWEKLS